MPKSISIRCPGCKRRLTLKNPQAAGKNARCPKCRKPFVIKLPAAPKDDFDDLDDFEEGGSFDDLDDFGSYDDYGEDVGSEWEEDFRAAPPVRQKGGGKAGRKRKTKRSRKKRGSGAWIKPFAIGSAAVLALALMVGGGFLAVNLLGGLRNSIDLAYVPPDADMIVVVRMADIWESPVIQSLQQEQGGGTLSQLKQSLRGLRQGSGEFDPESIESVTLALSGLSDLSDGQQAPGRFGPAANLNKVQMLVVVRTRKRIDEENEIRLMSSQGRVEEKNHQGETYHLLTQNSRFGLNPARAAYFADSRSMLVGTEQAIKRAIEQGSSAPRRPELDFIDGDQHLLVVVPKKPETLQNSTASASPVGGEEFKELADKLEAAAFGLTFTDGIAFRFQGNCAAAADAEGARKELADALEKGRKELSEATANLPANFNEVAEVARSVLDSVAVEHSGTTVNLTASVSKSEIDVLKNQNWQQLMMMGMMAGGGFPASGNAAGGNQLALPGGTGTASPQESFPTSPGIRDQNANPASAGTIPKISGLVVILEMKEFHGSGSAEQAARRALGGANIAWVNPDLIFVNEATGEVIIGTQGRAVNTGPATAALENNGFTIGRSFIRSSGYPGSGG